MINPIQLEVEVEIYSKNKRVKIYNFHYKVISNHGIGATWNLANNKNIQYSLVSTILIIVSLSNP
jgi:hypothetical protein